MSLQRDLGRTECRLVISVSGFTVCFRAAPNARWILWVGNTPRNEFGEDPWQATSIGGTFRMTDGMMLFLALAGGFTVVLVEW